MRGCVPGTTGRTATRGSSDRRRAGRRPARRGPCRVSDSTRTPAPGATATAPPLRPAAALEGPAQAAARVPERIMRRRSGTPTIDRRGASWSPRALQKRRDVHMPSSISTINLKLIASVVSMQSSARDAGPEAWHRCNELADAPLCARLGQSGSRATAQDHEQPHCRQVIPQVHGVGHGIRQSIEMVL